MSKTYHASMIPLFIFAALSRSASVAAADVPADLSDAVAQFVPDCAARCLVSFLGVNYARGDDSDQYLTLDFVCAHRGRSGYTVSEGALQCLTAERSVGYCDDDETGDAATSKVNHICSGKTDVAKAKGGVITATLRYASESGVLTFAPITTSASPPLPIPTPTSTAATSPSSTKTTATTTTPTTLITDTRTISLTTTATTTTTTASSSLTTTSTPTPTVVATADGPPPPLSKGQIAGISIGAVCITAGIVLGIFLLTRLLVRRRRRRNSGSSFGGSSPPGGYGPARRDTWGYGFDKTTSNSRCSSRAAGGDSLSRYPAMSGAAGAGPAPTSGSNKTSNTKEHRLPYNRESWRPSAIGLAISPSKLLADRARTNTPPTRGNTPTRGRPLSKLLPAKPDMQPVAAAAVASSKTTTSPPPKHPVPMGSSYQESYGSQVPKQYQQQPQQKHELLHPIAAQFMRPAKRPPSLRLFIPDAEPPPTTPPPPFVPSQDKELPQNQHHRAGRESTLTEFEEDDDLHRSTSTAAGQIWCPPSATAAVPASGVAAPYYVADGRGNWVLGGDVRSPLSAGSGGEVLPRIATARTGIVTTAVQTQIPPPRRSPREPASAAAEETRIMAAPTGSNDGNVQLRPNSPQELAATPLKQPPTQAQSEAKPPEPTTPSRIRSLVAKTVPSPLFSRQPNPRSSSAGSHPLPPNAAETLNNGRLLTARPTDQERVMSTDSCITTFSLSSANSADFYHNNKTNNLLTPALPTPGGRSANNLSPVVESPPRGRAAATTTTTTTAGSNTEQGGASSTAGSSSRDSRVFTDPPATVAASETSSGGVSPVSYPRIPGRGTPAPRSRAMFAGVAPSRAAHVGSQPRTGQPGPTMHHASARQPPPFHFEDPADPLQYSRDGVGSRSMARGRGGVARGRGGTMRMIKTRPPSHDMTGGIAPGLLRPLSQTSHAPQQQHAGLPTLRIVQPSPEPQPAPPRDDRSLLPSSSVEQQQPPSRRRPPSHLPHPFPLYPVSRPRPSPPQPTLPIVADRDGFNRYPGMPMPRPYKPQDRHEPWRPPRASTSPSYDAAAHDNSSQEALATASPSSPSPPSLLAKRLGPTRAADMALAAPQQDRGSERWKQQQQQQQKQQKHGGNGEAQGKPKVPNCPETPDLPSTPTWLPRLTPTRRGTDLVLNVG